MRKMIFFPFFLLWMTACTQYQYITLDSNIYQQDSHDFIWENDTVRIKYAFSGQNCPLNVEIFNKLAQPIYVDWKKSAIIYDDGSSFSLWNDQTSIETTTVGGAVNIGNITIAGSQTNGITSRPDQISFIPPTSNLSVRPVYIRSNLIERLPENQKQQVILGTATGSRVGEYQFDSQNSPFYFRCFLTLSTKNDFSSEIYIDQPFWASKVIETKHQPEELLTADNLFYVCKTTTAGHILAGAGVTALVVGATYGNAQPTPPPHHQPPY